MLSCYSIILNTANGKREILVSPFLLQSKEPPNIKAGKISKLFFYENWADEEYQVNLQLEQLADEFKTDGNIINYGQDFGKYYLGSLNVNYDNKNSWGWEGQPDKLDEKEIKALGELLFNPGVESRRIIISTPTRPSDFNLTRVRIR